jgi:hypothetical protein
MNISEIVRLPDAKKTVKVELREVLHDLAGKPQRFTRVRITGWHFPARALEEFVVIGQAVSDLVIVSPDGLTADAYFLEPVPAAKSLSFGYGRVISWDFPVSINPARIRRIDVATLPKGLATLFG